MVETISEDEYADEVQKQAEYLAEAAVEDTGGTIPEAPHDAVMELVSDILDYHDWFARSHYGPAAHGCIVEHSETDPAYYSDWQALSEAEDPATMLKRVAYCVFEADVIEAARERLDSQEPAEA